MQFSEPCLALLREFEGFSATPYLCATGACTIGYGTNLEVHRKYIPSPEIARNTRLKGTVLRDALKKKGLKWDRPTAEAAMLDELQTTPHVHFAHIFPPASPKRHPINDPGGSLLHAHGGSIFNAH